MSKFLEKLAAAQKLLNSPKKGQQSAPYQGDSQLGPGYSNGNKATQMTSSPGDAHAIQTNVGNIVDSVTNGGDEHGAKHPKKVKRNLAEIQSGFLQKLEIAKNCMRTRVIHDKQAINPADFIEEAQKTYTGSTAEEFNKHLTEMLFMSAGLSFPFQTPVSDEADRSLDLKMEPNAELSNKGEIKKQKQLKASENGTKVTPTLSTPTKKKEKSSAADEFYNITLKDRGMQAPEFQFGIEDVLTDGLSGNPEVSNAMESCMGKLVPKKDHQTERHDTYGSRRVVKPEKQEDKVQQKSKIQSSQKAKKGNLLSDSDSDYDDCKVDEAIRRSKLKVPPSKKEPKGKTKIRKSYSKLQMRNKKVNGDEGLPEEKKSLENVKKLMNLKGIPESVLKWERPASLEVRIQWDDFKKVFDPSEPTKLLKGYAAVLDDALLLEDFPCSFNAKKYWKNTTSPTHQFGIYGYCRGCDCETAFTAQVRKIEENEEVVVDLNISGKFTLLQKKSSSRQLKNWKREEIKNQLVHEKAFKMLAKRLSDVPSKRFLHMNLPQQSLKVLQLARCEAHLNYTRVNLVHDLEALSSRMEDNPIYQSSKPGIKSNYIQSLSQIPFTVGLYSPLQMQFGTMADVCYLDATGCITQEIDGEKTLLFTLLGKSSEAQELGGVPIMEFVTNVADAHHIKGPLLDYRNNLNKIKPGWKPTTVCSDFAFANLHAISQTFNNESLIDNVNRSFDNLFNKTIPGMEETEIMICKLHVINAWGRNLNKKQVPKEIRRLAMHGMAKFQEASSLFELQQATTQFITVFGCRDVPASVNKHLVHDFVEGSMQEPKEEEIADFFFTTNTLEELEKVAESKASNFIQRDESKFYQYFLQREKVISDSVQGFQEELQENVYYNNHVMIAMREHYYPYINLWSACTPRNKDRAYPRLLSTAPVESYFKTHKTNFHRNSKEDIVVYIEEHGVLIQGMVNDAISKMMQTVLGNKQDIRKNLHSKIAQDVKPAAREEEDITTELAAKETWRKRRRRQGAVYQNRKNKMYFKNVGQDSEFMIAQKCVPILRRKLSRRQKLIGKSKKRLTKTSSNSSVNFQKILKSSVKNNLVSPKLVKLARRKKTTSQGEGYLIKIAQPNVSVPTLPWRIALKGIFKVGNISGEESDISSLYRWNWLSSNVMDSYPDFIANKFKSENPCKAKEVGILHSFALQVQPKEGNAALKIKMVENSGPEVGDFDLSKGKLFHPAHFVNHWFLVVCDFETKKLKSYDSFPGLISTQEKEIYHDALAELLTTRYGVTGWKPEKMQTNHQAGGHECGESTLMNMEAIMWNRNVLEVKPSNSLEYRNKIASNLLGTTRNGQALLETEAGIQNMLRDICERVKQREKVEYLVHLRKKTHEILMKTNGSQMPVINALMLESDKVEESIKAAESITPELLVKQKGITFTISWADSMKLSKEQVERNIKIMKDNFITTEAAPFVKEENVKNTKITPVGTKLQKPKAKETVVVPEKVVTIKKKKTVAFCL